MQVNVSIWKDSSPHRNKSHRICSFNSEKRNCDRESSFEIDTLRTSSHCSCLTRTINLQEKISLESQWYNQNASEHSSKGRHSAKTEAAENTTESFSELDKLLQITSQCIQCYNKFAEQKDRELKIVKSAFAEIHESLNVAFNGIIIEIRKKHNEIEDFLQKKQRQLIKIKDSQQTELNSHLCAIKSMHLMNLLKDNKHANESLNLKEELNDYANTLRKFYQIIEKVERYNFKEGVDETINSINSTIEEQMKFLAEWKAWNSQLHGSFSFNDKFGVSLDTIRSNFIGNDSMTDSLVQNLQKCIQKNHKKQVSQAWTQTLHSNFPNKKTTVSQVLSEVNRQQNLMKSKIGIYKKLKL